MIKLSGRQKNTLIDALHCFYVADKRFMETNTESSYREFMEESKYVEGVLDALRVLSYHCDGDEEGMYRIYPTESFNGSRDKNGICIPIMKIDAKDRKIVFDLFNDPDMKEVADNMINGYLEYVKAFPESFEFVSIQ